MPSTRWHSEWHSVEKLCTSVLCGNSAAQFAPDCFAQYCSKLVIASLKVGEGALKRLTAAAPLFSLFYMPTFCDCPCIHGYSCHEWPYSICKVIALTTCYRGAQTRRGTHGRKRRDRRCEPNLCTVCGVQAACGEAYLRAWHAADCNAFIQQACQHLP